MAYPSRDSSPRMDQRYGRHQGRAGGGGGFTDDGYASDMSRKHHPRDNSYQGRRQDHPKVRLHPNRDWPFRDRLIFSYLAATGGHNQ
jgi:hypothetical protein